MDPTVVEQLRNAGFEADLDKRWLTVPIALDPKNRIVPLEDDVAVACGEDMIHVPLKSVEELYVGDRRPPDFTDGPTPEYMPFFTLIEMTAREYCSVGGVAETDMEFHRLYALLQRNPGGWDMNPLYTYLRAAARLFMSIRDVSRFEYSGVMNRLTRSAKHFARGHGSLNYLATLETLPF